MSSKKTDEKKNRDKKNGDTDKNDKKPKLLKPDVIIDDRQLGMRNRYADFAMRQNIARGEFIPSKNVKSRSFIYNVKSGEQRQLRPGRTTNFSAEFLDKLIFKPDQIVRMRCLSAVIPHSFYNITEFGNILNFDSVDYTIPPGNYNVYQLRDTILDLIGSGTLTLTYDLIKNKYTFDDGVSHTIDYTVPNSIRIPLGFSNNVFSGTSITSDNVCQLFENDHLHIRTNLTYNNIYDSSGIQSNMIAKIPIDVLGNSVIFYDGSTQPFVILGNNEISSMEISLTYENPNELVNLNGLEWNLSLEITITDSEDT